MSNTQPPRLARLLFGLACRVFPRYANPHHNPVPEILVVANSARGLELERQLRERGLRHMRVYWPGRGERYLAGSPASRVTVLGNPFVRALSYEERRALKERMVVWGDEALWID